MRALLVLAMALAAANVTAQDKKRTPDIHYTPTRHNIAEAMLNLAAVRLA